jgi:hypothetical protein
VDEARLLFAEVGDSAVSPDFFDLLDYHTGA